MKNAWKRILSTMVAATAFCSVLMAPVSAGWVQSDSGWWYQHDDGSYPYGGWSNISGKWYLFDQAGYMLTGWQCVDNKWYYLNGTGEMATGWKQLGNDWYYLDSSGIMKTGWLDLGGTWYYFNESGRMLTGNQTISGKNYSFSAGGVWQENTSSGTGTSVAPAGENKVVYWGVSGTKYHLNPQCRSFKGTAANSGTLEQAKAAGREDWCGICSKYWTDKKLMEQGNPFVK